MRVRLVPLDDGPLIELDKDVTVIGRNDDCDIRFDTKSISKLHCVLVKTDGLVLVRDLGSTNGTRVNGKRVRRGALLPNDHIAFASFRYKLKFGEGSESKDERGDKGPAIPASGDAVEEAEEALKPGLPPLRRNSLPDEYPDASPKR